MVHILQAADQIRPQNGPLMRARRHEISNSGPPWQEQSYDSTTTSLEVG